MQYEFDVKHKQEYAILRDYYFESKYIKGILFILENEKTGEIIDRILPFEQANNAYEWEKLKNGNVKFQANGIEKGHVSKLIVETGVLKIEKEGMMGGKKEVSFTAKRYRYVLGHKSQ